MLNRINYGFAFSTPKYHWVFVFWYHPKFNKAAEENYGAIDRSDNSGWTINSAVTTEHFWQCNANGNMRTNDQPKGFHCIHSHFLAQSKPKHLENRWKWRSKIIARFLFTLSTSLSITYCKMKKTHNNMSEWNDLPSSQCAAILKSPASLHGGSDRKRY